MIEDLVGYRGVRSEWIFHMAGAPGRTGGATHKAGIDNIARDSK